MPRKYRGLGRQLIFTAVPNITPQSTGLFNDRSYDAHGVKGSLFEPGDDTNVRFWEGCGHGFASPVLPSNQNGGADLIGSLSSGHTKSALSLRSAKRRSADVPTSAATQSMVP